MVYRERNNVQPRSSFERIRATTPEAAADNLVSTKYLPEDVRLLLAQPDAARILAHSAVEHERSRVLLLSDLSTLLSDPTYTDVRGALQQLVDALAQTVIQGRSFDKGWRRLFSQAEMNNFTAEELAWFAAGEGVQFEDEANSDDAVAIASEAGEEDEGDEEDNVAA